jgi:hypothetical protein
MNILYFIGTTIFLVVVCLAASRSLRFAGVVLLVGATVLGLSVQCLGPGLIHTTTSTDKVFQWQVIPIGIAVLAGIVCLFLPKRHDPAA